MNPFHLPRAGLVLAVLGLTFLTSSRAGGRAPASALLTEAEQSGWRRTGRYDEVPRLCRVFAATYPSKVRCREFGKTPEGRPLVQLVASADGVLTPQEARLRRRPVILFQGGIHAGEIDGKDAGFWALREILAGQLLPEVLSKLTLVFVPVFNADGHERFGRNHRPNQVGPEEMGWRVTGQNLNLNRDYVKAEAPEMAAMLRLLNAWDPILYVDLHVSDGAHFQHDTWVTIQPSLKGPPALQPVGAAMSAELMRRLASQGHLPLDFYASFNTEDDPASGASVGVSPPKYSNAYWGVRNRFGVLVETHSWKDYATRVRATRDILLSLLEMTAMQGSAWMDAARQADADALRLAGTDVPLSWQTTGKSRQIEFLGYEYRRELSEVSGQQRIIYDPDRKAVWKIPLFDELMPKLTVRAPRKGYYVPPAHAGWISTKLRLHGVRFEELRSALPGARVETFRATEFALSPSSFEGRTSLTVQGTWTPETRDIAPGSLFVPIEQPLALLVMHLFEPQGPDSLLYWGFFNGHFEKKEYMEDYVAEDVARRMLASDPGIKAEFERRLATDPAFARSPEKRLEFFYRRHPSWDERHALYPVLKQ